MQSINRNYVFSSYFIELVRQAGVRYAVLSPGSRNTPLVLAAAENRGITCNSVLDERSAAFYATGLARGSGSPILLICTSGTAAAEYYPAVVEAYEQRIPLIICTADRPAYVRGTGANQTINQDNLYRNHIRAYFDAGLPEVTERGMLRFRLKLQRALQQGLYNSTGPIHINFPFEKPFEPQAYTDSVPNKLLRLAERFPLRLRNKPNAAPAEAVRAIAKDIRQAKRGLLLCGPMAPSSPVEQGLLELSKRTGFPLLADVASNLRRHANGYEGVITNYDSIFRAAGGIKRLKPDLLLQFGRTLTSKGAEEYLQNFTGKLHIVNAYGDVFDNTAGKRKVTTADPATFLQQLNAMLATTGTTTVEGAWHTAEAIIERVRVRAMNRDLRNSEAAFTTTAVRAATTYGSVMLSNSMPIRDADYFSGRVCGSGAIFHNRGASGIDGILSSAIGIADGSNQPLTLVTGDLAFLYDITALGITRLSRSGVNIIVVNNGGGGIFNMLPISTATPHFRKFFTTPQEADGIKIASAYGMSCVKLKSDAELKAWLKKGPYAGSIRVAQVSANGRINAARRKAYWVKASALLLKML